MNLQSLHIAASAAVLLFAHHLPASDGTIKVVIPAEQPSRPAHFNWVFESADGSAPLVGQFACGSYWVAPADGDKGVTMVSLTGNPEWKGVAKDLLSCDADPVTEKHGLLSGENDYGSYDATENVLPKLPMTFEPEAGSCISLVAAMQRNEAATSKGGTKQIVGEVADAYCVVTILPHAPRDGGRNMIRPNITGATKELLTWDDFDLTRLPRYEFLDGKSDEEWAIAQRRWRNSTEIFGIAAEVETERRGKMFRKFSEGGRAFRAHLLVHDYGSGMARAFNSDVLSMFSAENSLEDIKPALAAMLAHGLDIYHARYDIGNTARKRWSSGAGQSLGQFLPPVFAAALLKDETKSHRLRQTAITNHGNDPGELGPQELRQIKRGVTGVLLWGDGHPIVRPEGKMVEQDWRYWAGLTAAKCYDSYDGQQTPNPNTGKKTAADPYGFIDGPAVRPGSAYMGVSLGGFRSFAAAMILMPHIRSIINTDAPIEYVDRVTRHGLWTQPDPVAAPAKVDQDTARTWWSAQGCREWGKTWGPNPEDVRFAIEGGKGRFPSLHGHRYEKAGYESFQALRHWDKIISLYDGQRFEDNVVGIGDVVAPEILFATGEHPQAYLFCAALDARIHYSLDGSEPNGKSPLYRGDPIPVRAGMTVRAIALLEGKRSSPVRSNTVLGR
jgi:hypothetical protein